MMAFNHAHLASHRAHRASPSILPSLLPLSPRPPRFKHPGRSPARRPGCGGPREHVKFPKSSRPCCKLCADPVGVAQNGSGGHDGGPP